MTTPQRIRTWWRVAYTLGIVGVLLSVTSLGFATASAQAPQEIDVQSVQATSETVTVTGVLRGADLNALELKIGDAAVPVTSAARLSESDVPQWVVAVIDNAHRVGNGTLTMQKRALDALAPGQNGIARLGVITTGGKTQIEVPLTDNAANISSAMSTVMPLGSATLWSGITQAGELLQDRPAGTAGRVVVFSVTPDGASKAPASAAQAALEESGVTLEVVALDKGAPMGRLQGIVNGTGGSIRAIPNDTEFVAAAETIADRFVNQFVATGSIPADTFKGADTLTVSAGDMTKQVTITEGSTLTGAIALAPQATSSGLLAGLMANAMMKWVIVLLGVGAAVMLVWAIVNLVMPDDANLVRRLQVYEEPQQPTDDDIFGDTQHASVPIIQRAVEITGEMAERRGLLDKTEQLLEQAEVPLRPAEALFFLLSGSVIAGGLIGVLSGNMIVALVAVAVVVAVTVVALRVKVSLRQRAFQAQLPDMLALLAGTLRAGYSIGQGIESVSKEIDAPMGPELRRVVNESRLGRPLEEALDSVAERMQSDDFEWAVMAIRIQREVGGNLAELLMTVADTMTQRERLRREVKTLTAEGRISAVIIGAMPPGLALVMYFINREYISTLFVPGLGLTLVVVALVMMGIGFFWMKKTITIEA